MVQRPINFRFLSSIEDISSEEWNLCAGLNHPFTRYEILHALEKSKCATNSTGWQPFHYVEYDEEGNLIEELRWYNVDIRMGLSTKYHKNGNKFSEGEYEHGQKIGEWTEWYKDSRIKKIEIFRHDIPSTLKKYSYHSNRKVYRVGEYKFNQWGQQNITKHGTWTYYNEDGSPQKEEIYKDGQLIEK